MDATSYIDWIRRTLEAGLREADEAEQLKTLLSIHDSLLRGGMVLGCMIPAEQFERVEAALVPELRIRIEDLLGRGAQVPSPSPPHWRSLYDRTKTQTAEVQRRVASLPKLGDDRGPFVPIGEVAVGGLLAAGFASGSELLLVVSTNGRGVFDCVSGERVGRDPADVVLRGYPATATGIPPLPPVEIAIMGLDGGSPLQCETTEGLRLNMLSPDYNASVWIEMPGSLAGYRLPSSFEEVRAAGFSDSGMSLIVAEQHTLHMFRNGR